MRRLFSVGAHVNPEIDFWRYSRKTIASTSPEAVHMRSYFFKHSLEILTQNQVMISKSKGGHAGILIPLFEQNGELRVLLTQRSDFLSSHGGEVSFPGGKTDPGEDDLTAAVREGEEEIGLAPNQLEVLGCLPAMASKHGLVCSPFVALIDFKNFYPRPNLEEVQDVFSVPLSFFLDESNLNVVKYGAWTSYEWLYTREEDEKTFKIWGLTGAMILYMITRALRFSPKRSDINVEAYFARRPVL